MKEPKPPVVLIDGSSYLYRAFHALPPLNNSRGEPTGAVYGVLNMIRKLLADYRPELVAVVFDPKGRTFRDEIYPYYKANRPPMPEELQLQIKPLHGIIRAMGIPLLIIEGVEADDVIGTLAKQAELSGHQVLISTGDKDMAQLVDANITLINTMSGALLDEKGVQEKFGVSPSQIIDYLTLMGDNVDNIPGVPKVGPKTAAKWLADYKNLDNIIQHAGEISGKVGENLRANLDQLPLSKQLVTIKTDVALPVTLTELVPTSADQANLREYFQRLEFRGWLEELNKNTVSNKAAQQYQMINTTAEFEAIWPTLMQADVVAFDTETTDLDFLQAKIVGVSFAVTPGTAYYIPIGHDYPDAPSQLPATYLLSHLKNLLADPTKIIVGQNLKYDFNVLTNYAIKVNAKFYDTMLESYVLNSAGNRHDMDTLALKYLGRSTIKFEDIAGKGAKQLTFNQVGITEATEYAAQDADVTLQLHQVFSPKIAENKNLTRVLNEIELPLLLILADMERNGVLVDAAKLQHLSEEFAVRIATLEQRAHQLAGREFNLSSPKQLQTILYEEQGIPVQKKTPTGQPSTAEEVLQELALDYPLPKVILEHRSLTKLKSTYADGLLEKIHPLTSRVHTSYNQAVTVTGRLSSTDPNLQNIPIRTEEGRRIRQAFIAPKGHKIISADYSQIELRIMAHLSNDAGLIKAFNDGSDIHKATAAEVFNVPLTKVTDEQRRSAKAINFGLIYGMSAFGLASQLGVGGGVAQSYIDLYFSRYPGVKTYMDTIRILAHQQGYVETIFGRRLYLPEINVSNIMRRRAAERAAINAPMQGTAADIIKIAMKCVYDRLKTCDLKIKMIMQVHDELVFEVADDDVEQAVPLIRDCMTHAIKLNVPILVDIGIGDNWDEAH